jgi:predicted nucleic acid-binding protein
MNGSLFIDTNIAIYLLSGNEQIADLLNEQTVYLSFVTELELLSKPAITPEEERHIKVFLGQCVVIDFLPGAKDTVIDLRRRYRMKLPDAIVAATAYLLGLPLATADRGFSRVDELTLFLVEP